MSGPPEPGPRAVVVATHDAVVPTRATVRSVVARGRVSCTVLDVDGRYRPVADEQVVVLRAIVAALGLEEEAARAAATLEAEDFVLYAGAVAAQWATAGGAPVVVLGAGLHVVGDLREALRGDPGLLVVPSADPDSVRRRAAASHLRRRRGWYDGAPSPTEVGAGRLCNRGFFAVAAEEQARVLRELAADWRISSEALDIGALTLGPGVRHDSSLVVGPWRRVDTVVEDADGRIVVDGAVACAVDLSALDAHKPWILDPQARVDPAVHLSRLPALAALVADEAAARVADEATVAEAESGADAPVRVRFDKTLRAQARRTEDAGGTLPDLLGVGAGPTRDSWALELVPPGHSQPVARYLAAARTARPQVTRDFPQVPGPDSVRLARWALRSGVERSGLDAELLTRAAELTLEHAEERPEERWTALPSGVNLIGYLAGEIGLGESARLVDAALQAAGVPTSTHDVSDGIRSRRTAGFRESAPVTFDTSLLCVNGADTDRLAPRLDDLFRHTRVIGMWYWELEEFPDLHRVGFQHVDEVWAATDFMRDAIAAHAGDIPVRTVTPPLPQASDDPGVLPERYGIPDDRPWFLFTFDFLSRAVRKNPYGLVEAFTRAFEDRPAHARPVLVIKTINGGLFPDDAERLRCQVMGRDDVVLVEEYLPNHERHVLVSHCTAFVSLHRAEGLGLTIAEAMAWGKPVITTAYGGVMQFCTEENALLVGWERSQVEQTDGPYERGRAWAEPDLEQAAALMRLVVDDPQRARAVGERAAKDIRELHNADVAGARMRAVLEEGAREWRERRGRDSDPAQARAALSLTDKVRSRARAWRSARREPSG